MSLTSRAVNTRHVCSAYIKFKELQGFIQPGFFSRDATEPSEMESPIEGTTTLISAPLAGDK